LQHQRHSISIVAQSIFFAAYAAAHKSSPAVGDVVAVVGLVYALLWFFVAYRLGIGMESVRKQYIESDNPVWATFDSGLKRGGPLSGHLVLNVAIPWVTILAWFVLIFTISIA
ncbi:MAG: hypothetical protein Q7U07_05550, partial [Gammaproteobacteria bacterium]|nr:hypothetical protein [Gammaproteobacteria bacterium]